MKKIILSLFALVATAAYAQKKFLEYSGRLEGSGIMEKVDNGSGYTTNVKYLTISAQGVYGHLGYNASYNKLAKKAIVAGIDYGSIVQTDNDLTIVWGIGPGVVILPNFDPQKSKSILLGGNAFLSIFREKSLELNINGHFNSKLRNNNTEWKENVSFIELKALKQIVPLFGVGINLEYRNFNDSEPQPVNQNQPFYGFKVNNSKVGAGLFAAISPKPIRIDLGIGLQREKYSQSQINQPKYWSAGNWLLYGGITINYFFSYMK